MIADCSNVSTMKAELSYELIYVSVELYQYDLRLCTKIETNNVRVMLEYDIHKFKHFKIIADFLILTNKFVVSKSENSSYLC